MNARVGIGTKAPMRDLLIADRAEILVINEQIEDTHVLLALLSPHHNVHLLVDARAALRFVAAGNPVDLILLNVVMPSQEGPELCRELRKTPELQDIPIISLTTSECIHEIGVGLTTRSWRHA